jgi:hypothetical protein
MVTYAHILPLLIQILAHLIHPIMSTVNQIIFTLIGPSQACVRCVMLTNNLFLNYIISECNRESICRNEIGCKCITLTLIFLTSEMSEA